MLIASRFLGGFGASSIYALAGGVLTDVWRPEQRGRSLSIYLLIPLLGAAVGMRQRSHSKGGDADNQQGLLLVVSWRIEPHGGGCSGRLRSSRPS